MIGGYHKVNGVAIRYWTWPRQPAPARYRNITPSRTSWPPYGRRASPERIRRCWATATACAGNFGISTPRVVGWPRALVRDHPQLTTDEAAHFVLAAYDDLCPVPGAYDYWAYTAPAEISWPATTGRKLKTPPWRVPDSESTRF
jgi:hypothetical protein